MRTRSASLIAAAILTFSSLTHAQEAAPAATYHLVWLITERAAPVNPDDNTDEAWNAKKVTPHPDGYPLGVFVFPAEMPLATCSTLVYQMHKQGLNRAQQLIGNLIGHELGVGLEMASPLCLTADEAAKLVAAVKDQHDQPSGEDI